MKKIELFKRHKFLFIGMTVIGVLGALFEFYFYLIDSDSSFLISSVAYPVFIIQGIWQYYELSKYYFKYSKDKIEYKFGYKQAARTIELNSLTPKISINWRGLMLIDGAKTHQVSLDNIWKKERNQLENELNKFYG